MKSPEEIAVLEGLYRLYDSVDRKCELWKLSGLYSELTDICDHINKALDSYITNKDKP